MAIYTVIGCLSLLSGFLSGLLGIGGGIVMAPLLLYVPPLFGLESLSMRVVSGLTIVQGFVACISGAVIHRRFRFVSPRLSIVMGVAIFLSALMGGVGARFVSNEILLSVFGGLALIASILMLLQRKHEEEDPNLDLLSFSHWRAILAATAVGIFCGLVGQGGSFVLIPLMIYFVRIPTRIAIGSNLAIVFLSCTAGFIGKAATGQIEYMLALPILLAVPPAALLGSFSSRKTPVSTLRRLLALLIAATAGKIWWSLLFP